MDKKDGLIAILILGVIAYIIYYTLKQWNNMITGAKESVNSIMDIITLQPQAPGFGIGQGFGGGASHNYPLDNSDDRETPIIPIDTSHNGSGVR